MQISTETFGKVLVAHTPEEINEDSVGTFSDILGESIREGHVRIVLQMDRSEVFDGPGLTGLVDLHDELRKHRGQLVISGLRDPGRKIFEVTRLDQLFEVYESVVDAVSRLQS
jgi:anti-sigma B factor antagonist